MMYWNFPYKNQHIVKMDYLQIQERKAVLKNYNPLKLADNLIEIINQNLY